MFNIDLASLEFISDMPMLLTLTLYLKLTCHPSSPTADKLKEKFPINYLTWSGSSFRLIITDLIPIYVDSQGFRFTLTRSVAYM